MERIPLSIPHLNGNEWGYIKECLDTNWVSSAGKYVDKFETELAQYTSTEYGVATVNGTAAIHTALEVLGIKEGDKVLVPSLTFIAAVNPIRYCGAEPVFIDSEDETFNIDPKQVIEKIEEMVAKGEKPKAIIVVHLYGHPVDMDPIVEVCEKHGIYIIEDATEALGSKYKGEMVGSIGDMGCFSFNGNKLITTGGGGMLVTDKQNWAEKAKYLTTQAKDNPKTYVHNEVGYNYRLTNIQAAMGVAQLEQVDEFIAKKRKIASKYTKALNDVSGIKTVPNKKWAESNFWLYSILINEAEFGLDSKTIYKQLNENGIMARPFFKPIHHMPMYQECEAEIDVADRLWKQGINLPCSVNLTNEEVDRVVNKIKFIKEL